MEKPSPKYVVRWGNMLENGDVEKNCRYGIVRSEFRNNLIIFYYEIIQGEYSTAVHVNKLIYFSAVPEEPL